MDWLDNKRLFRWHGWLGLNFGLLLFVICFSGTIAVFSYEIDWLINPDMRVERSDEPVNWTAIMEKVRMEYPYHSVISVYAPRHPGFAAHVYATDAADRLVKLYAHPQTGSIQARGSFWNVQRFFRSFHRRMFVPGAPGIVLVTFFALVLLVSAVTGILFYKGWYRNLFRLRLRDWRLLFSDTHRLAGVWSLLFAALMVITGVWYMVEQFAPAPTPDEPDIATEQLQARGATPVLLDMNEQVRRAEAAYPGLTTKEIRPGTPSQPTQVHGQAEAWLVRSRANRIRVDAVTGDVLSVQKATAISAYHRWSDMADPLHFGTFGGVWTQVLWFICGLVLSSLMLTGGWLWFMRAETKARAAGAGRHPRWSYAAAAMPVAVLLVSAVLGYVLADWYIKPDTQGQVVASQPVGPWRADVVRTQSGPNDIAFNLYLSSPGGTPNVEQARLRLTCDDCPPDAAVEHESGAFPVRAAMPPAAYGSGSTLRMHIALSEWDDTTYVADIPLEAVPSETASHATSPSASSAHRAPLSGAPISPQAVRIAAGPGEIPPAVWIVIAVFVALTLGIVGAWLFMAQRASQPVSEPPSSADRPPQPPRPVKTTSVTLPTKE